MKTLITGSVGPEVRNLQEALNFQLPLETPPLKPDGIFGPLTKARLERYQKIRQLKKIDGIAGPETNAALYHFIGVSSHVLAPPAGSRRSLVARPPAFAFGDVPRADPVLPPIGPFQLPFPTPFRPSAPPGPLIPLPQLTLGLSTPFELSAGVQRTFARSLSHNKPDNSVSLFSDVQFSFWKRPLGKHVETSLGGGFFLEREVGADPKTSFRAGILVKAELVDVVKIGPLDLLKLIVEHKTSTTVTGPIELNSSIEVGVNPTVEVNVFGNKVEFGPKFSKFFEINFGKDGIDVKSGTTVTSGTVTVFF